jgi:membrane protein YqaA with SNARE-associated domain
MAKQRTKQITGRELLALFLFAAGLRFVTFILESLLVPDVVIRLFTVVALACGLVYLITYMLGRSLPRRDDRPQPRTGAAHGGRGERHDGTADRRPGEA